MAAQIREVPVVPHGLRPAETYAQLCQALQALQGAATDVFEMVESRVESERGRLRAISSRIRSAEAQIASLAGSRKAITIYSSAKYPQQRGIDYEPVFGIRTSENDGLKTITSRSVQSTGDWRDQPQGTEEALELFRFFSAAANQARSEPKEDGRPKLPPNLRSTANLLVFDSAESIFDKPSAAPEGRSQRITTHGGQERRESKAKAQRKEPKSIIQGDALATDDSEQFAFRPTLGAVPTLDLPPVLPDLPMIADISWTGEAAGAGVSAAPAHFVRGSSEDEKAAPSHEPPQPNDPKRPLPAASSLSTAVVDPPSGPKPPTMTNSDVSIPSGSSTSSAQSPPHPPQPLPDTPPPTSRKPDPVPAPPGGQKQAEAISGDPPLQAPRPLSPPPPPPPPPLQPTQTTSPPISATAGDPARLALLASIRNPGVQLRKVSDERSRTPSPRKELMAAVTDGGAHESRGRSASSPPPKGDMFAEMASQLMSRRLSMKGGLQNTGKDETASLPDEQAVHFASPPREPDRPPQSVPFKTPNLAALVAQRSQKKHVESDDDEDEWDD